MTSRDDFVDFVLDQLADLRGVETRRMFGGYGFYRQGVFFAIVGGGRLFFKVGDATRSDYESRGMGPFRATERQTLSSYYEVPPDILEDHKALVEWARKAVACQEEALLAKGQKGLKGPKSPRRPRSPKIP